MLPLPRVTPTASCDCCKNISNMNYLKNKIRFYSSTRTQIELTCDLKHASAWQKLAKQTVSEL